MKLFKKYKFHCSSTTRASTAVPSDIVKSQHVKRGRPTTRASTAVPSDMVKPRHVKRGRSTTKASAAVPSDMVKSRHVKWGRPTTRVSTTVPSGKHSAEPKFQQPEHVAALYKWWNDTFPEEIANDKVIYKIPDKKECIEDHYEKKKEFQQDSAIMLKKIVDMPQVSTYQETIQEIIGGRLTDSVVLKAVSDYIVTWLTRTSYLLGMLTELEVWDEEILRMIIVNIGELDDVGIEFPELKHILVLVDACLKQYQNQQENNVIFSFMAKALKDVVYEWHVNTCHGAHATMTRWSKNPTPTFEIPKHKLPYSV